MIGGLIMLNGISKIVWPEGKRFAFTIIDDTDFSNVENTGPVYDFLYDNGFITTKTVWPLSPQGSPIGGGDSLEDQSYRDFILDLKVKGFEIALHGVSDESSTRPRVIEGLKKFREIIGHAPRIHVNHTGQADSLYWGADRFDGAMKLIYTFARKYLMRSDSQFYGQMEGSAYFWGDLCRETITFVRNFVFNDINTLKMDPLMPYHDLRRPYVPYWFSASAGHEIEAFCRLLNERNQDKLLKEGGACIAYAHLADGFYRDGQLNPRFVELMRRLAGLPGWFVPVSTLLDYIGERKGWQKVGDDRHILSGMQWRWLMQKIKRGDEGSPAPVRF
jgi:hypothetical protein